MAELVLVDTSVLVAMERGELRLSALQEAQPGARLAISAITVSELLHGWHRAKTQPQRESRERFLTALLAQLEILPFDLAAAREHGRAWALLAERGEIIGAHDLIIAATALAHRIPLVTLNQREFRRVETLQLVPIRLNRRPHR